MAIVFSPFVLPPPIPPCTSVSTIPHSLSSCYSANNQYVLLSIAGFGLCVWCLQHNEIERVFRVFFFGFLVSCRALTRCRVISAQLDSHRKVLRFYAVARVCVWREK